MLVMVGGIPAQVFFVEDRLRVINAILESAQSATSTPANILHWAEYLVVC